MDALTIPRVLDGGELERFRRRLMSAIRCTHDAHVLLDAANVKRISAAGLDLLVVASLLADDRGIRLVVLRPSDLFARSIALTGLAGHLDMTGSARPQHKPVASCSSPRELGERLEPFERHEPRTAVVAHVEGPPTAFAH